MPHCGLRGGFLSSFRISSNLVELDWQNSYIFDAKIGRTLAEAQGVGGFSHF